MTEKKLSQFGRNVRKGKLMNTVTASFNIITGLMTEMSQRKKTTESKETVEERLHLQTSCKHV